jgi:hypothetical protein
MASHDEITVSPSQVVKWRAELAECENRARGLRRLLEGAQMIESARVILASEPTTDGEGSSAKADGKNFMGAIREIANSASKPMSKADLKEALRKRGFPESQIMGTYFYVALNKLDGKHRVSIQKDGTVWKGDSP